MNYQHIRVTGGLPFADCTVTHGNEFSSADEIVVVVMCFGLMFAVHVLTVAALTCCILRMFDVGIDRLSAPISGILTHIGIFFFFIRRPIRDQFKTGLFWL